ncbi:PAS domain S-box protein [Scytonema sp. UIC 10036]|uniref:PAS domain S-box protein n=1 Tax=Scytonema sp. UIC 10036 TaxID=2304196 RepID=UPI0012DA5AFB|nr:PAS domain S-box protein [Scytonema sp. UIC 10036]MUG99895.1 PAS domain S-box protein [Scytonema sp. UIC 10036]
MMRAVKHLYLYEKHKKSEDRGLCPSLNKHHSIFAMPPYNNLLMSTFALENATISSRLSIVTPGTPLVDIIPLLGQIGFSSTLPIFHQLEISDLVSRKDDIPTHCVLVMTEAQQLVGVVTERDLVKCVASDLNWKRLKVADAIAPHLITLSDSECQDLLTVVNFCHKRRISHLPIVTDDGQLLGIVTPDSIQRSLQPTDIFKFQKVAEVMTTEVIYAEPTVSILELTQLMVRYRVSSVVIAEETTENQLVPVGIVTERDIVKLLAQELNLTLSVPIGSVPLLCLNPEDSLLTAREHMLSEQVQQLVVSGDRGELLGTISQTHLLQILYTARLCSSTQMQPIAYQPESEVGLLQSLNPKMEKRVEAQTAKHPIPVRFYQQSKVELTETQAAWKKQTCSISDFQGINAQLKQEIFERLRAEAELQTAKDKLQVVLDAVPAFVSWISSDLKYLGVNGHLAKAFNKPQEDFIGKPFGFLQHSLEFHEFASNVFATTSDTATHEMSVQIDGSQRNYFIVAQKYAQQTAAVLIGIDITDSKHTEKQLQRQLAAVEAATDGIAILDGNSQYIYLNKAYVQLFGYDSAVELFGKTWGELYYTTGNSQFQQDILPILKQKGYWQGETIGKKRDGSTFAGEASLTMIEDGNFICVTRDITERKQIEAERDRLLAESRYNQALLSGQNHFLEMVATGTPLSEALSFLALLIEEQSDEGICCILQVDQKSNKLCSPVAPSLPQTYLHALDKGIPIVPIGASSGTAAYRQKTVIVSDIANDPLWDNFTDFRDLALSYKLKSCWSMPIFASNGDVVGTLTMYYRTPRFPNEQDTTLLLACSRLGGIAIERHISEIALRESEQKYRSVVDTVKEIIFQRDKDGLWTFLNPAWTEITGFSVEESLGTNFLNYIHPDDRQQILELCQILTHSHRDCSRHEVRYLTKDGSFRWMEVFARLIRDASGVTLGTSGTLNDITQRKQAEQELRKALEKEKELNQLKSRFVSMTSHEFRTPLTTIMGTTELLKHYSNQWNEDKKLVYFDRIHTAVNRMTQMLDDVLLLGKVEAGKWDFYPIWINLVNFCNSLIEELQLTAQAEHKIILTIEGEPTDAYIDEKLLTHILNNLLSNAIKYSPLGGNVRFSLIFLDREIVFQVQDRGIGIPKEDQKHLFEGFYRAHNVGKISGTGLGLAIVKKAVELHKGKITVNSEVGVGTTFTVTILKDSRIKDNEGNKLD